MWTELFSVDKFNAGSLWPLLTWSSVFRLPFHPWFSPFPANELSAKSNGTRIRAAEFDARVPRPNANRLKSWVNNWVITCYGICCRLAGGNEFSLLPWRETKDKRIEIEREERKSTYTKITEGKIYFCWFFHFNLALWLIHRKLFDKVYSGYKMSNIMFIIQAAMFIVNSFVSHQRINKVESVFLDW